MRLSISPTPSNTPSNTPTITPSVSNCPDSIFEYYMQPTIVMCDFSPLPSTGWTIEYKGISYTGITNWIGDFSATWCNVGSVDSPSVGQTYRLDLTSVPSGHQSCLKPFDDIQYDRIDYTLTSFIGTFFDGLGYNDEWNGSIEYYFNDILQLTLPSTSTFYKYLITDNENCNPVYLMYNQDLRFQYRPIDATPTPSPTNTQTTTPTTTQTNTPTNTSTPSYTPTKTATPTLTPSKAPVCPEQLIITNSNNPEIIDATYTRSHINSGGTFDYGYNKESGGTDSIIYGVAPDGRNYPIFQYYNGTDYTTIYKRFLEYNQNLGWYSQTQSTNILTGATFTGSMIGFSTGDTLFNGVYYPPQGQMQFGLDGIITYPTICPTPTATPTNTKTPTATPTSTPTITPSNTSTSTPTNTQTSTPTNTSTNTPTNTQTPTPTSTTPITYYKLDACAPATGQGYTNITPGVANQRYFDFINSVYYVWDNTSTITPGTIVSVGIVSGQAGCP